MAILVTGSMGHVGYVVACRSAAAGERVIAQYRTSYRSAEAEAAGSNVTWVACDLADRLAVERLAAEHAIDACIHLAAVSNEAYAKPEPLAAVQANVGAAANLLDMARRRSWRRFILVSTGGVFQDVVPEKPIYEDAQPDATNIFGTTKHCSELLTRKYLKQFELQASTVRISWVYGPRLVTDSPARGPIPSFLIGALKGEERRDASGGDFAASFTFVEDAADGLLAAARAQTLHHDIYHLGPGRNFSAREVGEAVKSAVPGAVIELGPGTLPWTTYTALRGPLAGDRLRQETGYSVGHSLEQGVRAYADWLRAHPELYL
ncbi:MAG: NAD-dependent epimerase/dehydratase family protein [Geminicoccaceae bacterium]